MIEMPSAGMLVQMLYFTIVRALAPFARRTCWICWLGGIFAEIRTRSNLLLLRIKAAEASFRSLQLNSSTPTFQQFLVCNAVCSTSIKPTITFLRFGFFVSTSDSTNRRLADKFFEFDAFQVATWFNATNVTRKYAEMSRNVSLLQLRESEKSLLKNAECE